MNLICGINPVIEALAAGTRHFDRLLIVKGLRSRRLSDAIRRATQLGIPLRFEMRETLDRMAAGVPHQGIIAVVSEKPVLSLEDLLESTHSPALVVVLDRVEDPTPRPRCRPRAPTVSSCPSATARGSPRPLAAPPPARSSTSRWRGWATSCRRSRH
jgi:hypothetical protein